jgi:hypothetical protein
MRSTVKEGGPAQKRMACWLQRNGVLSAPNNTGIDIPFDAVVSDPFGMLMNGNCMIPVAGIWDITAMFGWAANPTGLRMGQISINGTPFTSVVSAPSPTQNTNHFVSMPQKILRVGDWLTLRGYQGSGGALNVSTIFQAQLREALL